jgi:hypothetical protein
LLDAHVALRDTRRFQGGGHGTSSRSGRQVLETDCGNRRGRRLRGTRCGMACAGKQKWKKPLAVGGFGWGGVAAEGRGRCGAAGVGTDYVDPFPEKPAG